MRPTCHTLCRCIKPLDNNNTLSHITTLLDTLSDREGFSDSAARVVYSVCVCVCHYSTWKPAPQSVHGRWKRLMVAPGVQELSYHQSKQRMHACASLTVDGNSTQMPDYNPSLLLQSVRGLLDV